MESLYRQRVAGIYSIAIKRSGDDILNHHFPMTASCKKVVIGYKGVSLVGGSSMNLIGITSFQLKSSVGVCNTSWQYRRTYGGNASYPFWRYCCHRSSAITATCFKPTLRAARTKTVMGCTFRATAASMRLSACGALDKELVIVVSRRNRLHIKHLDVYQGRSVTQIVLYGLHNGCLAPQPLGRMVTVCWVK